MSDVELKKFADDIIRLHKTEYIKLIIQKMDTSKLIDIVHEESRNTEKYCKQINDAYAIFKTQVDDNTSILNLSELFSNVLESKTEEQVIRAYVSYFYTMYAQLSYTLIKENYELSEQIKNAIAAEKDVVMCYCSDSVDDELLAQIKYVEEYIKRQLKI